MFAPCSSKLSVQHQNVGHATRVTWNISSLRLLRSLSDDLKVLTPLGRNFLSHAYYIGHNSAVPLQASLAFSRSFFKQILRALQSLL